MARRKRRGPSSKIQGRTPLHYNFKASESSSFAPKARSKETIANLMPEKGSVADKIVDTITPKTGVEAITMIGGGALLGNAKKIFQANSVIGKVGNFIKR